MKVFIGVDGFTGGADFSQNVISSPRMLNGIDLPAVHRERALGKIIVYRRRG
jgi:hypothetical protein